MILSDPGIEVRNAMVEQCRRWSPWLAFGAALICILDLVGWATGIRQLTSVGVGLTTMKVNTAIGLLLGSMAIVAKHLPAVKWRRIAYLFAAMMAVLALLTLTEYVFRIDLRIDNAWVLDRGASDFPGRFSPATALCFIGFSAAIILGRALRTALSQALFIASSIPAAISVGGYVLGAPGMYLHVAYPAMAVNTSVSVILLAVAGLLESPDRGLMRVVTSVHRAGGVSRMLLPLGAGLPLLVGLAVVSGEAAGLYSERFAFSLLVTVCATLFITATWWTTWLLLENETKDIANRRRVADELLHAKNTAEAASRAKDQFLAVLSHELRTPLTPVLATVELMERELGLTTEGRESIQMIRRNIQLEARLIDDLLDLTRIARGKITLHLEAVDVHAAIKQTVETWQSEIDAKQLRLELSLCAEHHTVWADPTRFRQVLWNLLGNALKFTPERGLISVRTLDSGDDSLTIEVRDSGVGIEPQMLDRLFSAFEQGEATISRRFGGLGLGLSISKSLLEMHSATIEASSAGKDQGATFIITFKAIEMPEPAKPAIPAPTMSVTSEKKNPRRILLVEDNNDTLKIMKLLLKKLGFEVVTAMTVQAALEIGNAQHFDLLVSDIGLPDGSGWDIMTSLKQSRNIRGVAISGFGMEEDLQRSKAVGFEQHLVKPVSFEILRDAVQEAARP